MESLLHIYLLDGGGLIQQFIEWIINNGGLYFLLFVIFAETGLFVGFFLPGDSLLFAAGIFMGRLVNELAGMPAETEHPFGFYHVLIILMVIIASIIGNIVGYWFGYKAGPLL
ncbi:MAG: DedA family protein, partial [Chitinophagaceae bacterium]